MAHLLSILSNVKPLAQLRDIFSQNISGSAGRRVGGNAAMAMGASLEELKQKRQKEILVGARALGCSVILFLQLG